MTLSCDILQLAFVQNTRAIICDYYEHFWYVSASFVLKVFFPKEMFFDEIVFKVTSAMVMTLTKLSLFFEAVFLVAYV